MKYIYTIIVLLLSGAIFAHADGPASRPDAHAPIGVMGDHTHKQGEIMLSYRYMYMGMNQNYDGSQSISTANIVKPNGSFTVSPKDMTMQMHMIGAMYALWEKLTIMAMVPIVQKSMNHTVAASAATMAGVDSFNVATTGVGDAQLNFLSTIFAEGAHRITVGLGSGLPTGSINASSTTPVPTPAQDRTVPYPMQLGSGTFDALPSLIYVFKADAFSIGTQAKGTIRIGRNSADYRLGDRVLLTSWFAYKVSSWLSTSLRAEWQTWGNVTGADSRIAQSAPNGSALSVPTAQPALQAGNRLDVFAGFNLYTDKGPGIDQRLAFEFGYAAYQHLQGPQLGNQFSFTVGWQSALVKL
jgi:hypothetical protein